MPAWHSRWKKIDFFLHWKPTSHKKVIISSWLEQKLSFHSGFLLLSRSDKIIILILKIQDTKIANGWSLNSMFKFQRLFQSKKYFGLIKDHTFREWLKSGAPRSINVDFKCKIRTEVCWEQCIYLKACSGSLQSQYIGALVATESLNGLL